MGKRFWITAGLLISLAASAQDFPAYKPSSRSPEAIDIRSNAYGLSPDAPKALEIGDTAPDIAAPRVGGGVVNTRLLRRQGEVVLVFYRGPW